MLFDQIHLTKITNTLEVSTQKMKSPLNHPIQEALL